MANGLKTYFQLWHFVRSKSRTKGPITLKETWNAAVEYAAAHLEVQMKSTSMASAVRTLLEPNRKTYSKPTIGPLVPV